MFNFYFLFIFNEKAPTMLSLLCLVVLGTNQCTWVRLQ